MAKWRPKKVEQCCERGCDLPVCERSQVRCAEHYTEPRYDVAKKPLRAST